VASFNTVEPARRRIRSVSRPAGPVASPETVETLARHMHEHPLLAYHQASGDGASLMLSDLVTRRQFRDSALYREFYGPLGIQYQMTAALALGPQANVGIALSRCRADFTEQERELLDLLRPHLARAYAALDRGRRTVQRRRRAAVRTAPRSWSFSPAARATPR